MTGFVTCRSSLFTGHGMQQVILFQSKLAKDIADGAREDDRCKKLAWVE